MKQLILPKKDYTVFVKCFTYNQSKYIEDALNGFAMQQTNFPFVCFVMDDASTDRAQDIIKEWIRENCDMNNAYISEMDNASVYIVAHKLNTFCTFAFYFLKNNLYSKGEAYKKEYYISPWRKRCKYEALCEGDDYWIDPLKLQKQVDFLEMNPEYGLVFTDYEYLWEERFCFEKSEVKKTREKLNNCGCDVFPNYLFYGDYVKTCTVCFRLSVYSEAIKIDDFLFSGYFPMGDTNTWFAIGKLSKLGFINEETSVYRKCKTSVTLQKNKKKLTELIVRGAELRMYFMYKMNANFSPFYKKQILERYEHAVILSKLYDISILDFGCLSVKVKFLSLLVEMPIIKRLLLKLRNK